MKKEHLQRYFNQLANKNNLKLLRIKQIKTFISTVLNYAVNEEYIVKNYCSSVKLNVDDDTTVKHKALTDEEINTLINNCKNEELLIIIKLLLSTAMRINELLAITENDIDFNECSINVNKSVSRSRHYHTKKSYHNTIDITSAKTKSSNRIVYFNPALKSEVRAYIKTVMQDILKMLLSILKIVCCLLIIRLILHIQSTITKK